VDVGKTYQGEGPASTELAPFTPESGLSKSWEAARLHTVCRKLDVSQFPTSASSGRNTVVHSASLIVVDKPISSSHLLREGDELVEGFAPTVVKAHLRVLLGDLFVAVDRDRGVFGAGAVRLE
jgi:hypothetical protein